MGARATPRPSLVLPARRRQPLGWTCAGVWRLTGPPGLAQVRGNLRAPRDQVFTLVSDGVRRLFGAHHALITLKTLNPVCGLAGTLTMWYLMISKAPGACRRPLLPTCHLQLGCCVVFELGCAWAEPAQLHVKGFTVRKQRLRRARGGRRASTR